MQNDYYRFQVLNDPEGYTDWADMMKQNYGKFSESSYPYQLWEVRQTHMRHFHTQNCDKLVLSTLFHV
jgi:hypothetical protein